MIVGKVESYIYIGIQQNVLNNITLATCMCQMMRSNGLVSGLNYFYPNNTCQLFSFNISLLSIQFYANSSFRFVNQSFISIALVSTKESTSTSSSTTITSTRKTTSSSTSSTSTSSSTSSTSTSTSASADPCMSSNRLWNTTGITVSVWSGLTKVSGLFIDSRDTLFIVDQSTSSVVWKLLKNTTTATIVAGVSGLRTAAAKNLNYPQDAYFDSKQTLYVSDYTNYRIQKYINGSTTGITMAGITGSSGSALNQLGGPRHITFDATESNLYVVDGDENRIMRYPANSTSGNNGVLVAGGTTAGNANTQLNTPWGIFYNESISNYIYTTNADGHTVMKWLPGDSSGTFVAGVSGVLGSNATLLNSPRGMIVDAYLNVYVADYGNDRIQLFCAGNPNGITIAGNGTTGSGATSMNGPRGIAFDSSMNLYVGEFDNARVLKFLKL
ncbi:unnamed protein product [Adineta ricciae]|uniref:NHL repeat containing protein-like protein n=1 Tax=Adineta ricciae TaxID=249248 RepID=A0A815CFX0_ADIRI|nr:unnamed protein product [Adineta ricciae]